MTTGQLLRPLTPTEAKIARLVSMGCDYKTIAARIDLTLTPSSVRVYVCRIAAKIPNPDGLKPYTLVLLWSAHQRWLEERDAAAPPTAA